MNNLSDLMQSLARASADVARANADVASYTHEELYNMMNEPAEQFTAGDFVQWKAAQLSPSRLPLDGQRLVFVRYLPEPLFDRNDGSGSPFYMMPLDMVVSTLGQTGEYIEFAVDSRRIKRG